MDLYFFFIFFSRIASVYRADLYLVDIEVPSRTKKPQVKTVDFPKDRFSAFPILVGSVFCEPFFLFFAWFFSCFFAPTNVLLYSFGKDLHGSAEYQF
jgi:hypothetical protein